METLNDYTEKKQSALLKKHGVFFAFSNKSFDEQKKEGVTYSNLGAGCICPKKNALNFVQEQGEMVQEAIQEDIADNGIEGIIRRELSNYECYYSGDTSNAFSILKEYGITKEQIKKVYNAGYMEFWKDN